MLESRVLHPSLLAAIDWSVDWSDVATKAATVVGIIVGAFLVSRISRWFIGRTMHRLLLPASGARLSKLRERTPNVLLRTGDQWSLRADARIQTLTIVARSLVSLLVWFVALVWILEVIGVNLGPLIAGAGIAGVALGFGAQNIVRDFLSGFFLIVEDQFGVGDIVDLGEAAGTVEKITLRSTRLRDVQGVVWHVPNGEILRVANQSQEWARALLDVQVSYDTDLDLAQQVIADTANTMAADPDWALEILDSPEVWGVEAFTPTAMAIRVVIKTRPAAQFGVMREFRQRIKKAFDENGIVIPTVQIASSPDAPA